MIDIEYLLSYDHSQESGCEDHELTYLESHLKQEIDIDNSLADDHSQTSKLSYEEQNSMEIVNQTIDESALQETVSISCCCCGIWGGFMFSFESAS